MNTRQYVRRTKAPRYVDSKPLPERTEPIRQLPMTDYDRFIRKALKRARKRLKREQKQQRGAQSTS